MKLLINKRLGVRIGGSQCSRKLLQKMNLKYRFIVYAQLLFCTVVDFLNIFNLYKKEEKAYQCE